MARPGKKAMVVVLAVLTAGLGSCGGEDESGGTTFAEPKPVTSSEGKLIRGAESAVDRYCQRLAANIAAGRGALAPAAYEQAVRAVDRLAVLAREKPDAPTAGGVSPELALGDIAEGLEGSNCDQRIVERIDAALAEIPRE